jgi:hypothetical protein
MPAASPALDRLDAKISPEPNTGCWLWTGCLTSKGYGHFGLNRRAILAHRAAYELLVGPIPSGLELDHLCRVRSCVNPAHLEPVTHAENVRRGAAHGTYGSFERAKTHCPKGHPYSGDNLVDRADGSRSCRACAKARSLAKRKVGWIHYNAAKTHCSKGHPFSGDNLYIPPSGKRMCKACRTEGKQRAKEAH